MEIRSKVAEFVERKVKALRKEHTEQGDTAAYQNVSVVRANTMKYLCNFFNKGQLEKLLFLFPDPHFKAANHRYRPRTTCRPIRTKRMLPGPARALEPSRRMPHILSRNTMPIQQLESCLDALCESLLSDRFLWTLLGWMCFADVNVVPHMPSCSRDPSSVQCPVRSACGHASAQMDTLPSLVLACRLPRWPDPAHFTSTVSA